MIHLPFQYFSVFLVLLLFIAETCVFAYLGMAIFSFKHQFRPAFVIWTIVSTGTQLYLIPIVLWPISVMAKPKLTPTQRQLAAVMDCNGCLSVYFHRRISPPPWLFTSTLTNFHCFAVSLSSSSHACL